MKLGIGSFTYGWGVGTPDCMPQHPLTLLELLERAHGMDLHLVQACSNLPLETLTPQDVAAAKQKLEEYEIELELGTSGLTDAVLERYLELAGRFDAKLLRMVIDLPDYDPSEEQIVGILQNWRPTLEHKGVRLGIENHDHYPARMLARICAKLDSPCIGMCLDTANSFGALEDTTTLLGYLAPHAVNLHLKDITIERLWSKQGFTIVGAPVGSGMLDIPFIVKQVAANGRDANWIVEQWTAYENDLETTVEREEREGQQSVEYLRQLIKLYQ